MERGDMHYYFLNNDWSLYDHLIDLLIDVSLEMEELIIYKGGIIMHVLFISFTEKVL